MDFFFDGTPSTSQSTPKSGQEDPETAEVTHHNSSTGTSSKIEIQEQHGSSSIEDISRKVQDLVETINNSRSSDQKVMESFQEKLMAEVTDVCQQMKEGMYSIYEENSNEMQVKLQELSEVLVRCTKLNKELIGAGQALAGLRECLSSRQTSEKLQL